MRLIFFVTALVVFILDRITKVLAVKKLHGVVSIIPGFFSLRLAENRGAAFSLFSGGNEFLRKLFLIFVPAVVIFVIFYYVLTRKKLSFWVSVALGLMAGGAVGNLYDRILDGRVIDFMDFHFRHYHYPTFNVADVGVFVGTLLLLVFYRKS